MTDDAILQIATDLFPRWREDIQERFVLLLSNAVLGAYRASTAESTWRPIETAPKDMRPMLLWLPPVGGWAAGPWRGSWSFGGETWCLHTPLMQDGKCICLTENPEPTHWMPFAADPAAAPVDKKADLHRKSVDEIADLHTSTRDQYRPEFARDTDGTIIPTGMLRTGEDHASASFGEVVDAEFPGTPTIAECIAQLDVWNGHLEAAIDRQAHEKLGQHANDEPAGGRDPMEQFP